VDILLIDDEAQFLKSFAEGLQMRLSTDGILTACDGIDALDIMRKRSVDVVVSDLNMPNMDGIEFLSRVQKQYPRVPIIIMSAQTHACVAGKIKFLRIFEYFEKPLDLEVVARSILAAARNNATDFTSSGLLTRAHD